VLATCGFIVSVHSYPACAWHTVDGILFSVLSLWLYAGSQISRSSLFFRSSAAGFALVAALLCKQSFYPLAVLFPALLLLWNHPLKKQGLRGFATGILLCTALFFSYLHQNNLLENYFNMTGAAASGGQALQHGILDYLRIKPVLALCSVLLWSPVVWWFWKRTRVRTAHIAWRLWLVFLLATYSTECWKQAAFTAPFAQARLFFLVGAAFAGWQMYEWYKNKKGASILKTGLPQHIVVLLALLAVSWSASVSWGYNLPILFATPWVFAGMEIGRMLWGADRQKPFPVYGHLAVIALLLAVARFSYEFVYRDGKRSEMTEHLGAVFPQLRGIYSTPETAGLYKDMQELSRRYGPDFAVLPAFPQAHFLTGTCSPLPLDWVVRRETNGNNDLIMSNLETARPVLFIQKSFLEKIETDPELALTKQLMERGSFLEETPFFRVVRYQK
jgi:hypothetical protein